MIFEMTLFEGRYRVESARLANWDYSASGWYFATICTREKACSLGRAGPQAIVLSEVGLIAATEMELLASHYRNVLVDRFVVMPNHVHAIVVIAGQQSSSNDGAPSELKLRRLASSLSTILGSYKAGVSRICGIRGILNFQWQRRFHDHILRSNASVNTVRDYIEHNPQNWLDDPDNTNKTLAAETRRAASLHKSGGRKSAGHNSAGRESSKHESAGALECRAFYN
jgi:putative transposase